MFEHHAQLSSVQEIEDDATQGDDGEGHANGKGSGCAGNTLVIGSVFGEELCHSGKRLMKIIRRRREMQSMAIRCKEME